MEEAAAQMHVHRDVGKPVNIGRHIKDINDPYDFGSVSGTDSEDDEQEE